MSTDRPTPPATEPPHASPATTASAAPQTQPPEPTLGSALAGLIEYASWLRHLG